MEQERENTLERLEAENNDLRGKIESVKREYEEKRAKMHGMLERMSSAIREYIEFQQSENATKYESMTNEETKHDTEDQEAVSKTEIEVIKIVGNGISVSRKICQENKDLSSPIVFRCLLNLLNKGYLYSINRMKIIDGTYLTLYGLTNKGKEIYKREVGNDPNEPEMEKLKTLYGTYQHGYSVFECQKVLEKIPVYSQVAVRADKVKDGAIEDVICFREDKQGPEAVEICVTFENFHKQGKSDCFHLLDKCVDAAMSWNGNHTVNVIVPDYDDAYSRTQGILTEWARKRVEICPEDANAIFRLVSFSQMKECTEDKAVAENIFNTNIAIKDW